MSYYFSTVRPLPFEEVIQRVSDELQKEGFGLLTDIDVKSLLKEKLEVEHGRYRILGACNPAYALRALKTENKIGTMLPCNVIVREIESGQVEVAAVDPVASMLAIKNRELQEIAIEIQRKLIKVIERI